MTRALARLNAEWMDKAICVDMPPEQLDIFFDDTRTGKATAKAICANCPVTTICKQTGQGQYGMRGGKFTPAKDMHAGVGEYLKPLCGSDAGHQRHRRNGENPCQACTEAHDRRRARQKENR